MFGINKQPEVFSTESVSSPSVVIASIFHIGVQIEQERSNEPFLHNKTFQLHDLYYQQVILPIVERCNAQHVLPTDEELQHLKKFRLEFRRNFLRLRT